MRNPQTPSDATTPRPSVYQYTARAITTMAHGETVKLSVDDRHTCQIVQLQCRQQVIEHHFVRQIQ